MGKEADKRVRVEMCCRGNRTKGGIVAVNKNLECKEMKVWSNRVMEVRITFNNKDWRIFTVYSQNVAETINVITNGMEKREEKCLIIRRNFNAKRGRRSDKREE